MVGIHRPRHSIAAITVVDVGPCIGHGTLVTVSLAVTQELLDSLAEKEDDA